MLNQNFFNMKKGITGSLIAAVLLFSNCQQKPNPPQSKDPLAVLMAGNSRFTNNQPMHPDESIERKKEISRHQEPFAVIISCSDSRVPPEIIFDQGLGDLFVIRTAGNLISDIELGSIEYAVAHLGVKLVMVLGHQNCGVIKAFLSEEKETGYIAKLVSLVENEEEEKNAVSADGDKMNNCVLANVEHAVKQIKSAFLNLNLHEPHKELKIVGAKYELTTGKVEIVFNENSLPPIAEKK